MRECSTRFACSRLSQMEGYPSGDSSSSVCQIPSSISALLLSSRGISSILCPRSHEMSNRLQDYKLPEYSPRKNKFVPPSTFIQKVRGDVIFERMTGKLERIPDQTLSNCRCSLRLDTFLHLPFTLLLLIFLAISIRLSWNNLMTRPLHPPFLILLLQLSSHLQYPIQEDTILRLPLAIRVNSPPQSHLRAQMHTIVNLLQSIKAVLQFHLPWIVMIVLFIRDPVIHPIPLRILHPHQLIPLLIHLLLNLPNTLLPLPLLNHIVTLHRLHPMVLLLPFLHHPRWSQTILSHTLNKKNQ